MDLDLDVSLADGLLRIIPTGPPPGLRVVGEVDLSNAPVLSRALGVAAQAIEGMDLHLDLAELKFIDLDGLRVLVRAAAELSDGRSLVLDAAPPEVHRVMRLIGWDRAPGLAFGGERR